MATLETTCEPPLERERFFAPAAALLTVTLWASAFVGIRSAGHDLSPGALALGRLLVASVALGAIALARREPLPSRRDLRGIAFVGVLWFALYSVVLNAAEQRVDAGTAAMLVNVGPIFIALLAGLVLREGFPRGLLIGCAIAFAGAVVIGAATSKSGLTPSWAPFSAWSQRLPTPGESSRRSRCSRECRLCRSRGSHALRERSPAFRSQDRSGTTLGQASGSALAWTVYLGVVPTAIGFIAWAYALSRTTAGRMGSTTYLVTPIAILLGWLLLDETPPALALLGGALCLAGVAVARRLR